MKSFNDGRDWFFENRFGLFIHWGLYAVSEWHEQVQWRKNIAKAEYIKLVDQFNPIKFNPDSWMEMMKAAGMDYICFTTKHHDGFCMWDSQYNDYNIMNTPYKKDILKMLSEACKCHNIKLCLYYSCPDWHHPNSINQGGDHQLRQQNPGDEPDDDKYIEYVKNQVTELCTDYGKIHALFWDIPPQRHEPSINKLVRSLQPGIMINDRGWDKGDYNTPERHVPDGQCFERATEANQSVGQQSWGYRANEDYFSHKHLMESVAKIMTMGGNYLLNVGPKADGAIPAESEKCIKTVGNWYNRVKEALTSEPFSDFFNNDFMATRDANNIYLTFHKDPKSSGLVIPPIDIPAEKVVLLNTGKELTSKVELVPSRWQDGEYLHIQGLPVNDITNEPMVVKVEFSELSQDYIEACYKKQNKEDYIF